MTYRYGQGAEPPDLHIKEQFDHLFWLEVPIDNTGPVDGDVVQKCSLLYGRQVLGLHWVLGNEEKGEKSNHDSHGPHGNKHDSPSLEVRIGDMLKSERL